MSQAITHDEAFAALDAVALDAIDPVEREAVMAHVSGCAVCRAELDTLRDTASMLAFSSPLAADTASRSRDRIRSKLAARAAADRGHAADFSAPSAPPSDRPATAGATRSVAKVERTRWGPVEWLAAAAIVLLLGNLAELFAANRNRNQLQSALAVQTANDAHAQTVSDSLRAALMSRDSIIAGLTGKDVAMMTLTANGVAAPSAGEGGHMFWDHDRNTWTLVAHGLPALKPGRTYQLWLVTASGKVSAGTFAPVNGDAIVRATYPLAPSDLQAIAVTDEPAGGMPQPTGPMIIASHS